MTPEIRGKAESLWEREARVRHVHWAAVTSWLFQPGRLPGAQAGEVHVQELGNLIHLQGSNRQQSVG